MDSSTQSFHAADAWEQEAGTIYGAVNAWDEKLGIPREDEQQEQGIATSAHYLSSHLQLQSSPDGAGFQFTKALTTNMLSAGLIELPPNGIKNLKNARRFHFIFFMHYGKVQVEVAGNTFSISTGGMWQVPRGNTYQITNLTNETAKIVFAQAVAPEPGHGFTEASDPRDTLIALRQPVPESEDGWIEV